MLHAFVGRSLADPCLRHDHNEEVSKTGPISIFARSALVADYAQSRPATRQSSAANTNRRTKISTDLFHGARTTDVKSTVQALRRSLPEETPLAMVGYSMGGIIAMNYVSIAGVESGVSCCVSMSGSFDTR